MRIIKDFPIMFKFFCKNVVKTNGFYNFDLYNWENQLLNRGFIKNLTINLKIGVK